MGVWEDRVKKFCEGRTEVTANEIVKGLGLHVIGTTERTRVSTFLVGVLGYRKASKKVGAIGKQTVRHFYVRNTESTDIKIAQPGYHLTPITRGVYGEPSKIREELEELEDSLKQGNRIMALVELADLYGALEGVAKTLGVEMADVKVMAEANYRAFTNGHRTPK